MNKFWKIQNSVESDGAELILEGAIASETWWGDEVTPAAFRAELKQFEGRDLTVVINSGGGDVFAGLAIYDALTNLNANITVRISGLAASIASVVAMAGDKIIMSPGSMMMIHKPWVMAAGDANELAKSIEVLNGIEKSIVPIYVNRSGLTEERVRELLEAETWMSADEAVELGFADEAVEAKTKLSDAINAAFNGKLAFQMAVKQPLADLAAKLEQEVEATDVTDTTEKAGTDDVEQSTSDDTAPEVKAQAETDDTTEVEEVTETATEETKQSVEEETIMEVTDIVKDQVQAVATAPVAPAVNDNYIKSPKALEDFANVLMANAGRKPADVKNAWTKTLEVNMGITNPEVLLPPAVIQAIEDAFKEGGEIWNAVNKTGLDVYAAARDTVTGEDSRAKGYNRAEEATKAQEVITLQARTLRPQFVYKYLVLPREVIKEQRSTGALLRYVLSELPKRIVREVERAIVIGDGRTGDYAISSFESIKSDAAVGVFATTHVGTGNAYEDLLKASAAVKADGSKMLVAKSDYVIDVLTQQGVNGGYLFQPGTDIARVFGFSALVTPDWMEDDADNDAYIFTPANYKTVGDNTIESFTNFALKTNENEFLQEIWVGGGLTALKAGVAISNGASS
ncbi:hypothetical protein EOL73_03820 [Candidatus Saccharibacteria bacterium]|nr:hypothetical protein [Candidatus Saccharibacteria bacterium]